MSAIFNFQSLLLVILLFICTCTYIKGNFPYLIGTGSGTTATTTTTAAAAGPPQLQPSSSSSTIQRPKGLLGIVWKAARIGERLSPYISVWCIVMASRFLLPSPFSTSSPSSSSSSSMSSSGPGGIRSGKSASSLAGMHGQFKKPPRA